MLDYELEEELNENSTENFVLISKPTEDTTPKPISAKRTGSWVSITNIQLLSTSSHDTSLHDEVTHCFETLKGKYHAALISYVGLIKRRNFTSTQTLVGRGYQRQSYTVLNVSFRSSQRNLCDIFWNKPTISRMYRSISSFRYSHSNRCVGTRQKWGKGRNKGSSPCSKSELLGPS